MRPAPRSVARRGERRRPERTVRQIAGCRHLTCDMNTKLPLLLAPWLLMAVAACGPQAARTASHSHSARLTPSPSAPAPLSATPSPSPSAPPVPAAPPPPLVVVRSPNGMVAATTADGAFVWSFDPRTLAIANPVLVPSGPNLLAYGARKV